MAMTYLTKLKPEPMGVHSPSTAYGVNSLVMSEDGAAAYISVKDVPAGTPLTNTEYWKKHTDLSAVKQSAEAAAQRANAARNEMLEIARSLTDMVEKSGNPVQAELVGGLPFDRVETMLEFIQSGSGDPSPSNIRTISGWTGAKLTRCGKNLCPNYVTAQTVSGVTFTVNGDGSITSNGTATASIWMYVSKQESDFNLPVGAYTLSGISAAGSGCQLIDYTYTAGGTFITNFSDTGSGKTINVTDATVKHRVQIYIPNGTSLNDFVFRPMIRNASDTDSSYEPYHGDTYTADFGQTVYGGTLDWNTGVLTVNKAYKAIDGTSIKVVQAGAASGKGNAFIVAASGALMPSSASVLSEIMCSHYKTVLGGDAYNGVQGICIRTTGAEIYIYDSARSSMTSAEYNGWLSAQYAAGTPVQACYKLATPTTIQLTPQEIKQLQGMNTLYGDGSISMTGRADKALALEARIAALEAALAE